MLHSNSVRIVILSVAIIILGVIAVLSVPPSEDRTAKDAAVSGLHVRAAFAQSDEALTLNGKSFSRADVARDFVQVAFSNH